MSTVNPVNVPATQASQQTKTQEDPFGKDAFMKLLVSQMKNQSPTNPADSDQWIGQMTQYSILEQLQQQSAGQTRTDAAVYLGRNVTWQSKDGHSGSGLVEGVDYSGDEPTLTVAGQGGIKTTDVLTVQ